MNRKWNYFIGASILAAYVLLSNGAPLMPVAAGIAGAAVFMRRTAKTA